VKMKIGRDPERDIERVRAAREAIGPGTELFVDANGAYSRKQALAMAEAFDEFGVSWFEEPVSSDDLAGLRLLRDRAPPGMDIAAGEYGYDLRYFQRMLKAGAVDVLQANRRGRRCDLRPWRPIQAAILWQLSAQRRQASVHSRISPIRSQSAAHCSQISAHSRQMRL
jgi:hypothetical protein